MGLVSVNAQNAPKKVIKKAPAKTEVAAKGGNKNGGKSACKKSSS